MNFTDTSALAGTRETQDGYLIAEAFVARTGIQLYDPAEVGMFGDAPVRVYRPEDEVKAPASVRTYTHAPVTMGHPSDPVTKDNWADLAKGEVSTEAEWRDGKLRLPLIVKDANAIAAVKAGTRELSAGYTCFLDATPGVTEDGEEYDAVQRDIRINHLAIVPKGRAGIARIGDAGKGRATWGATPLTSDRKDESMADAMKTRTVLIDGLSVETTDAGAQALEKLQSTIADSEKALSDAQADHKAALDAKDAEIATKDAEIEKLTKAQVSDADMDKRVEARAGLVDTARKIAKDVKVAGLSDAEIRKAAVVAKLGDAAIADKSDAYIEARFDVLAEDAGKSVTDPVADALVEADPKAVVTRDTAYAARDKAQRDAWKPQKVEA